MIAQITQPAGSLHEGAASPLRLVIVSAGVSDPSTSRMLADRIAQRSLDLLRDTGNEATVSVVELAPLAVDIAQAIVSGFSGERLQAAIGQIAAADAVIVSTPVYKAGISGLFKSFLDILDNDLLVATPIVLAATAGTARHAMVVDDHLRPLFAFMRALPVPTSVFAAPEDWGDVALGDRVTRAAQELTLFLRSGVGAAIAERAWSGYKHQFGGSATRAARSVSDIDFSSELMLLAAGGRPVAAEPGRPGRS